MPLYDYECSKCASVFEVRQKFDDPLLTEHEGCGGKVERLLATPALQFKGSGFYITDYKNSSTPANSSKSEPGSPAPAPAATESKPASTPAKSE
jgi:putative FmdB family regulatory protein